VAAPEYPTRNGPPSQNLLPDGGAGNSMSADTVFLPILALIATELRRRSQMP